MKPITPTRRLALVNTVGTLLFLGLAVLGWGGCGAFFSHPALTTLAIATSVLSGVALFSGGNLSPGEREDRGNSWVINRPRADWDAPPICRPTQAGRGG
jgi:hypothetical protein